MTANDYSEDVAVVANAMNAVYENKVVNKKNSLTGDYSTDNVSYPTCQSVKNYFGQKVTQFNATPLDTNYPSEKLVKDSLDGLETDMTIDVVKQATAETGYASTYYITQGGVQVGAKINIAKDKMVRSVSIATVGATPTAEESTYNMVEGDQYILMVVNTVDNDGATNLIIPITSVFDLQSADETTLTLSATGVFSIKNSGVDTAQLKDGSVTYAKLNVACINSLKVDMQSEISAFATALAAAINPQS